MHATIVLDDKTLCDLECIFDGQFAPLMTFMGEDDWRNVCMNMHLNSGSFFPLPVTLALTDVKINDLLRLVDSTSYPIATLRVTEVYKPDIDWECNNAYGTTDSNHPYVAYKQNHKDLVYVSGELTKLNDVRHYDFKDARLTPKETRAYFAANNWDTVVAFQTRNPMHKAHYELTKYALNCAQEGDNNPKLLLNPVVGETQSVDIDYHVRVHCYKEIIKKYEENQALLSLLPLAMRMAGPREACLHALIRKNYGCTHFVVGRDHAGPSFKTKEGNSFYGEYDAQNLFTKYSAEIGIKPIVSKMIVFNKTLNCYQAINEIDSTHEILKLSGTELRRKLVGKEEIPEWFSYPEVISILKKSVKNRGICYYFVGLSGSGKTTYANILRTKLLEHDISRDVTILDGDIIRQELSKGLGFSRKDRSINVRRIGYVSSEIVKHGGIVICANIAPYDDDRLVNRKLIEDMGGKYIEIFVDTSLDVCEKRDIKGLYKLAREGIIKEFTGISDPFENPSKADIIMTSEQDDSSIIKLVSMA